MKKSYLGMLIGLFLFSGSFSAVKASGLPSTGGAGGNNSGVKMSNEARSTRTDVGSLPSALQSVLSETLGANDPQYRVTRSGGAYRAVNAKNRLTATIGLDGFTVRTGSNEWGLRLTAWGPGRCLQKIKAGRVVSGSDRVDVDRGGIVEWWANGPLGIEQGWTVADRPRPVENLGQLTLVLSQSGGLRTQAFSHGRSLSVSSHTGREVLRYTGLTAYDKNGRQLPAHFETTRQDVRVVVDDTRAAYPVRVDPWVEAAQLTASNGAADYDLGHSVAVSPDGTIVVAGAPYATVGSTSGQGAVYVFQEPASGWASGTQVAELTASDGVYYDTLGWSVAISQDGSTIVAGAYGKSDYQGAVYVFEVSLGGWASRTQVAELTASDAAAEDYMGASVAVSSDGTTVVAGAYGQNDYQGEVYVFKEPPAGWANDTETAELFASDVLAFSYLGASVAVTPDGTFVVAGAYGKGNSQGAVYVFKEPASGWAAGVQFAELVVSDGAAGDRLGSSVAVSSDGTTVVAGADGATVGSSSGQGAVYVFAGWLNGTQPFELTASDGAAYDSLGSSVALSPDGATIVAGAPDANVGGVNYKGAVYVFNEPASGWAYGYGNEAARLIASDGYELDELGWSVAVSTDGATVVGGAPGATLGTNVYEGAVRVF